MPSAPPSITPCVASYYSNELLNNGEPDPAYGNLLSCGSDDDCGGVVFTDPITGIRETLGGSCDQTCQCVCDAEYCLARDDQQSSDDTSCKFQCNCKGECLFPGNWTGASTASASDRCDGQCADCSNEPCEDPDTDCIEQTDGSFICVDSGEYLERFTSPLSKQKGRKDSIGRTMRPFGGLIFLSSFVPAPATHLPLSYHSTGICTAAKDAMCDDAYQAMTGSNNNRAKCCPSTRYVVLILFLIVDIIKFKQIYLHPIVSSLRVPFLNSFHSGCVKGTMGVIATATCGNVCGTSCLGEESNPGNADGYSPSTFCIFGSRVRKWPGPLLSFLKIPSACHCMHSNNNDPTNYLQSSYMYLISPLLFLISLPSYLS